MVVKNATLKQSKVRKHEKCNIPYHDRSVRAVLGCSYPGDDLGRLDTMTAQCVECDRIFDLTDEDDAAEWSYGHDCE